MHASNHSHASPPWQAGWSTSDASLTVLLVVQAAMMFVVVPLVGVDDGRRLLLELGHLLFAAICVLALSRHGVVRALVVLTLLVVIAGPAIWSPLDSGFGVEETGRHVLNLLVAFGFNTLVASLVAFRTFGPGPVSGHRIQGAVFIYLIVASLFGLAYALLDMLVPGAIKNGSASLGADTVGARTAAMTYFSLSTITTTGYGDLIPVHPVARSLATLEATFGTLFPATFVARLVGLRLARQEEQGRHKPDRT